MSRLSLSELPSHLLIEQHALGNRDAAEEICARYVARMVALAESRMSPALRRRYDGADAVQSALRSFFLRAGQGDFEIRIAGDLWRLLATLTIRKVLKRVEREQADKRAFERIALTESDDLQLIADRQPTPDDVAALQETVDQFLLNLPSEVREVVALRMQVLSVSEIAVRIARSERTVRRWLESAERQLAALLAGDGVESP